MRLAYPVAHSYDQGHRRATFQQDARTPAGQRSAGHLALDVELNSDISYPASIFVRGLAGNFACSMAPLF